MALIRWLPVVALLCGALYSARPVLAQAAPTRKVEAEDVRRAIESGRRFLLSRQDKAKGGWDVHFLHPIGSAGLRDGTTGLCTLALINAGEDIKSKPMQAALGYLRKMGAPNASSRVYSVSLQIMALAAAEPERDAVLIDRCAAWLAEAQVTSTRNKGGWSYGISNEKSADESNTQFALLALHEAERIGIKVKPTVWPLAAEYWLTRQLKGDVSFGSWGYQERPGTGSMTCAGLTSLIIASGRIHGGDVRVQGDNVICCGGGGADDAKSAEIARAIDDGLNWLGKNMSVDLMPGSPFGASTIHLLYYLYGLERVGRLTAHRFIGEVDGVKFDWYRQGAAKLIKEQAASGSWTGAGGDEAYPEISTAFALLFLSKGRWPVVVARLKHGTSDDWTMHRDGVNNLVRFVETRWKKNLTWQVIDIRNARVEDLLEAPVLFISGQNELDFSPEQKQLLRRYVDEGGFIFAENCCGGRAFDAKFTALMGELFPESPLRKLDPSHPIWYADGKVDPEHLAPHFGIDACCRTSIVYCSESLSCYWHLSRIGREEESRVVQARITAYDQLGCNVLSYATNRELKEKLDAPQLSATDPTNKPIVPGQLSVAKVSHGGGADDAPAALPNLLRLMGDKLPIRTNPARRMLALTDPAIFENPVLFLHGRRAFTLSDAERQALRQYVERGGLLFVDAICSAEPFVEAIRVEMKATFKEPLEPIPASHKIFTTYYRGFDLATSKVSLREPRSAGPGQPIRAELNRIDPRLEGIEINGRYGVIFSPYDISCALENSTSSLCKSYLKADAAKIGVNVLLYALQE